VVSVTLLLSGVIASAREAIQKNNVETLKRTKTSLLFSNRAKLLLMDRHAAFSRSR
jgi:hypothetical protein